MQIDFMIIAYLFIFHELRKTIDMAATETRNYGNKARGVERRRLQNEETEEEKKLYLNTKENLQKIL